MSEHDCVHEADLAGMASNIEKLCSDVSKVEADYYGISGSPLQLTEDHTLIRIGNIEIECLATPGHTAGSQCFYFDGKLITGDTLFIEGCGRTDLPGGNTTTLLESLQKIKSLPKETIIYPGHDYGSQPHDSLENQIKLNPYLQQI